MNTLHWFRRLGLWMAGQPGEAHLREAHRVEFEHAALHRVMFPAPVMEEPPVLDAVVDDVLDEACDE